MALWVVDRFITKSSWKDGMLVWNWLIQSRSFPKVVHTRTLYSPVEGLLFLCGWSSSLRPLQIKSHCLIRCTLEIVSVCIRLDWFTLANIPSLLCRQRLHMSCSPFCLGWGSVPHVQREIFVFFLMNALEECSGQMDSSRHLSFQVLYYLVTFVHFSIASGRARNGSGGPCPSLLGTHRPPRR